MSDLDQLNDDFDTSVHILKLPSTPSYMSIMRTLEGKPVGFPLWNSFDHKPHEISMDNETISSTFLALMKNISGLSEKIRPEGKVIRLSLDNRTYSVFSPAPNAEFQISFVVVFEDTDSILIDDKSREDLVRKIIEKLKEADLFLQYIGEHQEIDHQIAKNSDLDKYIRYLISQVILEWDNKRVKYVKEKMKRERKALLEKIKEEERKIKEEEKKNKV